MLSLEHFVVYPSIIIYFLLTIISGSLTLPPDVFRQWFVQALDCVDTRYPLVRQCEILDI